MTLPGVSFLLFRPLSPSSRGQTLLSSPSEQSSKPPSLRIHRFQEEYLHTKQKKRTLLSSSSSPHFTSICINESTIPLLCNNSFAMLLGTPTSRTAINAASFETFFEGWLVRQEHYLDELLCARRRCQEHSRRDDAVAEEDLRDLIARVLSHYQEYYEEKSRAASRNVFLVFSPTWFTPFERTFFWIAGFKPGLAFRLVENAVDDLTEDQNRRMVVLMNETKAEERELADQMARIQESVAAPPMLELARREGRRLRDGEIREVDAVLETLRSSMELVLGRADSLRRRTAERVAAVLSPPQNVKFLAAATQLQYRIRMWGLNKEAERQTTN